MKELTIEEKAKAYDEALAKAVKIHRNYKGKVRAVDVVIEEVFPELKESEDEQHRKWILEYLYDGLRKSDEQFKGQFKCAIAWLEKQGEDEYIDPDTLIQQRVDALNDIIADQKLTDKVEPKFKVGDWTVSNLDRKVRQISEVHFDEYNSYYVIDGKSVNLEGYDRLHHLWTIQDAKNGDILSDGYSIVIFRGIGNEKWNDAIDYHIGLFTNSQRLVVQKSLSHWGIINEVTLYPATKEQRDLLFKKMKEVGYEWDAEKKELKKIEQTPTWSEEDEDYINDLINYFSQNERLKNTKEDIVIWLKYLRPQK